MVHNGVVQVGNGTVACAIGGSGPSLLYLHGEGGTGPRGAVHEALAAPHDRVMPSMASMELFADKVLPYLPRRSERPLSTTAAPPAEQCPPAQPAQGAAR